MHAFYSATKTRRTVRTVRNSIMFPPLRLSKYIVFICLSNTMREVFEFGRPAAASFIFKPRGYGSGSKKRVTVTVADVHSAQEPTHRPRR